MAGANGRVTPRTRSSVSLEIPEGWYVKESYTVLAPDGQANVIVSSEPLDPGVEARQYAEVQGSLLRGEFPGYEEDGDVEPFSIHGLSGPAFLRRFRWQPEDGVAVRQVQVYGVRSGRGFTATATAPLTSFSSYAAVLSAVLATLTVDEAAADRLGGGT